MAEPLLRKTFAKLRARRRKSLKNGRSEESDVSEKSPGAVYPEAAQDPRQEASEIQTSRTDSADVHERPSEWLPSSGESQTIASGRVDYGGSSLSPVSLASRTIQVPGASETSRTQGASEEGEIWYNPIPEDGHLMRLPWRPKTSRAQWYVEVPSPTGAGPPPSDRVRQHGSVEAVPGGMGTVQEQRAARCAAKSSPPSTHQPLPSVPMACVSWSGDQAGSSAQKLSGAAAEERPEMVRGKSPPSPSATSPRPPKKTSGARRSLSDRVKSPGTVRRLSIKMKKLPELRRKLSLRGSPRGGRQAGDTGRPPSPSPSPASSISPSVSNVLCRYHLDSSVSARGSLWPRAKPKRRASTKALGRPGYLSDGDSPELQARPGPQAGHEAQGPGSPGTDSPRLDPAAFRPYDGGGGGEEQRRGLQHLSGLINVRLYGVELPRAGPADICCAIQVDSVSKARTAALSCRRGPFLGLDHTFNLELERSRLLTLLLFSWDPASARNRLCCYGTAALPPLFTGARTHQLAMKLEPRGVLYLKVSLVELWEVPLSCAEDQREPRVFRMELSDLVQRENSGVSVPLLIQKCVSEIEKRGLKAVGLYRLCGSAAVKKELRDSFERDSASVDLSEEIYPDINVITGILKDYLRELPSPLITKTLYEVVLKATAAWPLKMTMGVPDASPSAPNAVALLDCLPEAEKATLTLLLDHLSLVASLQDSNKMTCQNLAVCFGPVLLGQKQEASQSGSRTSCQDLTSAVDFKMHIEVLHYLLQLWPSDRTKAKRDRVSEQSWASHRQPPAPVPDEVVCRSRTGRTAGSSRNRHAGDWSGCGRSYLGQAEGSRGTELGRGIRDTEGEEDEEEANRRQDGSSYPSRSSELDFESSIMGRTKEFDSLIADIERELAKKIIFL
ncbi:rho GTPase-activating protein SYDE1 [Stegostoma tigrinum]|uniref:rho GTPase-activating protein SYDE1 n=1 Tax=Stegostoma tigrinum TaxID=3053191 RepID=UPI00202B0004|nr:rho GTPase-activating protein SYDE1 [Stegostoma tigrinum]